MCNSSQKLVAWMDGELAAPEATDLEQHIRSCAQCLASVAAYEDVSRLFVTYCEVTATAGAPRRKITRWMPVLAGAAVAAAVLLLILRPASVKQMPVATQLAAAPPVVLSQTSPIAPTPILKAHRRQEDAPSQKSSPIQSAKADWAIAGSELQIAIPADAMFPPGAMPPGVTFIADVRMASDGSVQGLQLQQ